MRARCARLSNQGDRADRGAGAATDLERRGGENEFVDAIAGELLKVEALDDVDAALDEQMDVDGHGGGGHEFEGDGIGAGCERTFGADPAGGGLAGAGTADLRDELSGVLPILRPAGAQQDDIAGADFHVLGARGGFEMLGCNYKVNGENVAMVETGDIEENAAAEDRGDGVDGKAFNAAGIGLGDFAAIVQLAVAREVAESVDVGADVATQREGFGGGTAANGGDVLAVLLNQAEQVRRMHGVMRHADEIGLSEIVDFGGLEKSEKIGGHGNTIAWPRAGSGVYSFAFVTWFQPRSSAPDVLPVAVCAA